MSYKFRANYKFGVYEVVIRHHDTMTVLNLDAQELIDLFNELDFYHEKAEYELSKALNNKNTLG